MIKLLARRRKGFGSASVSELIFNWLFVPFFPLFQMTGEGGAEPILPGSAEAGNLENNTEATEESTQQETTQESTQTEETQTTEESTQETTQETHTETTESTPTVEELQAQLEESNNRIAELESDSETQRTTAEFYMNQYNELAGIGPDGQPVHAQGAQDGTGQPGAQDTTQTQDNIVQPGQWSSQEEEAAYFDNRIDTVLGQAYEGVIKPVFAEQAKAIQEAQTATALMHYIMSQSPEFEAHQTAYNEAMSSVEQEVFTFSPDGKQIIGVKNQALLNYFRAQPNPRKAMLDHAISKKAPQKIKTAIKKGTEKTLKKIAKTPKGPTMPEGTSAAPSPDQVPSQDQTGQAVEEYLEKSGLIGG